MLVWYGMVWYGMVWYGMVWYGMVAAGCVNSSTPMVWHGMVWYGMVWYGMDGMVWHVLVRGMGRVAAPEGHVKPEDHL